MVDSLRGDSFKLEGERQRRTKSIAVKVTKVCSSRGKLSWDELEFVVLKARELAKMNEWGMDRERIPMLTGPMHPHMTKEKGRERSANQMTRPERVEKLVKVFDRKGSFVTGEKMAPKLNT